MSYSSFFLLTIVLPPCADSRDAVTNGRALSKGTSKNNELQSLLDCLFLSLSFYCKLQSFNNKIFPFYLQVLRSPSCTAFGKKIWEAATSPSKPGCTMAFSPCGVPLELSRVGIMMHEALRLQFYLVIHLVIRISRINPYAVRGCSDLGRG